MKFRVYRSALVLALLTSLSIVSVHAQPTTRTKRSFSGGGHSATSRVVKTDINKQIDGKANINPEALKNEAKEKQTKEVKRSYSGRNNSTIKMK